MRLIYGTSGSEGGRHACDASKVWPEPLQSISDLWGVASNERVGRLIEGITILRRLWSEERETYQGKYYSFSDVELLPKPVQKPLPIFIAVNPKEGRADEAAVNRVLRRVAKYGDGWQTDTTSAETFQRRFDKIREYAAEEGRDPAVSLVFGPLKV